MPDYREDLVKRMLASIGDHPSREGLKDTPKRVVKMWEELFYGYRKPEPEITTFNNDQDGVHYDQMIIDTGDFFSHCEHHVSPFFGQYWFAYIPNKHILGISKVARVVDHCAAKLQIQERLNKEIVDMIEKVIKPKGIALVMKGKHLCKVMRGAKKDGDMLTSVIRGAFRKDPATRNEFIQFIQGVLK